MKREEIIKHIENLSHSQGCYGRLLESINEISEEDRNEFFEDLEKQNFTSVVDLVLYLEGN